MAHTHIHTPLSPTPPLSSAHAEGADPELDPDAKKFDALTFKEVIDKELRVMDLTAVTLCKENNLPIIIFDIKSKNGLVDVVNSVPIGTTVS